MKYDFNGESYEEELGILKSSDNHFVSFQSESQTYISSDHRYSQ